VAVLGTRVYLGFDASGVTAAAVSEGVRGRRARGFARATLEPGALEPSPSGPNLLRPEAVREAVRRAVEGLRGRRVTLVLPDGLARIALVEPPAGAEVPDYVRFRLAASLPWPAAEAIVNALPAGRGRVVGAAVRRAAVAEYEQAVAAVGLEAERAHLAPLLALDGIMRSGAGDDVHAVLGDVALCLASFRGGVLVALRSRRRDRSPGEAARIRDEAARAVATVHDGAAPPSRLVVSGAGAALVRSALNGDAPGPGLEGPAEWSDARETVWLGGLLS
jgi:hypothetical protein